MGRSARVDVQHEAGGEGGIRTHGTQKVQRFSRPPDSTALAPLQKAKEGISYFVTRISYLGAHTIASQNSLPLHLANRRDTFHEIRPYRRSLKNAFSISEQGLSRTPLRTSSRWFSRRSSTTFLSDPHAPDFGSFAPNTSLETRASTSAPAHIAQGSNVT